MKPSRTSISVMLLCVIGTAWGAVRLRNPVRLKLPPADVRQLSRQMLETSVDGSVPDSAPGMNREEVVREWPGWLEAGLMNFFGDPTPPPVEARTADRALVTNVLISAIWLQGDHRIAVINGCLVREGFEMSPLRVRRIESDAVVFTTPTGMLSVPIAAGGKAPDPMKPAPAPVRPSDVARSARAPGG
ncbi:MAG: hypothetical protein RIS76_2039 [Verrucomicrobiota bacterium]|jgi:hypothetical protein